MSVGDATDEYDRQLKLQEREFVEKLHRLQRQSAPTPGTTPFQNPRHGGRAPSNANPNANANANANASGSAGSGGRVRRPRHRPTTTPGLNRNNNAQNIGGGIVSNQFFSPGSESDSELDSSGHAHRHGHGRGAEQQLEQQPVEEMGDRLFNELIHSSPLVPAKTKSRYVLDLN